MANLVKDNTVHTVGTFRVGTVRGNALSALRELLGANSPMVVGDKVHAGWSLATPFGVATVYSYHRSKELSIGASNDTTARYIVAELCAAGFDAVADFI